MAVRPILLPPDPRLRLRCAPCGGVDGSVRATAVTVHGAMGPTGRPSRLPAWVAGVAG